MVGTAHTIYLPDKENKQAEEIRAKTGLEFREVIKQAIREMHAREFPARKEEIKNVE